MAATLRIGIIRLSALGDCIVSAAFLADFVQELKRAYTIHLTWFVDSRFSDILEHSPCIDSLEVITLKRQSLAQKFHLIKRLTKLPVFDILIDMQGLIKSALMCAFLHKHHFIGFSFGSAKESLSALFYTHRVQIAYQENILKRNALLLHRAKELLHIAQDSQPSLPDMLAHKALSFAHTPQAYTLIAPQLQSRPYILCVLESSLPSKTYDPTLFAQAIALICERLRTAQILLLTHTHTHKATQILQSPALAALQDSHTITPLSNLSLDSIKAIIAQMDLVIGGDTGITHLAWALGRDSLTLYGNTPAQRFTLLGESNLTLSGSDNPTYDKNDFSINNIAPSEIAKCALTLLSQKYKEILC